MRKRNLGSGFAGSDELSRRNFIENVGWCALGATVATMGVSDLLSTDPAHAAVPKPEELIVRVWGGVWKDAIHEGVTKPFEDQTGIRVRYDTRLAVELSTVVAAAVGQGRRPPMDVNWCTTTTATQDALADLTSEMTLEEVPNLAHLLPAAKPQGFDGYPFVSAYSYVYVLAYRESVFPDGPPDSWMVMMEPRFKGRVALYENGTGFHPVAQILGGGTLEDIPSNMGKAWEFIRRLKPQVGMLGQDADFTNAFLQDEIDLACTIMSNAREARMNGIDIAWTVPMEGAKLDKDGFYIPKNLPDDVDYWAKQYVNLALSSDGIAKWCSLLGLPPLRPGIAPPDDLVGDPAYPVTEEDYARLIDIPTKVLVENRNVWFDKFREIFS